MLSEGFHPGLRRPGAGFTPGTYEATAQGRNGAIVVRAVFGEDKLESIECDHMESRNIGDAAIGLLTDKYVNDQDLSVDAVSGATLTSLAFSTAVASCAEQAGADMRALLSGKGALNPAEPIDDEADVCVIGSGGAALAAAVTALEAGKSVVMLEKMDIYGGNTNAGEGTLNAPDPERQQPMGIEDSPDFYYQQTFEGGDSAGRSRVWCASWQTTPWTRSIGWRITGWSTRRRCSRPSAAYGSAGTLCEVERKGEQGGSYYVSCLMNSREGFGALHALHRCKGRGAHPGRGRRGGRARNASVVG